MKKKNPREIKIWNGGGVGRQEYLFIGAYSKSDACRMLTELYPYMNINQWRYKMDVYFSDGCWGNAMNGIIPERGIWLVQNEYTVEQTKPERIYPTVK